MEDVKSLECKNCGARLQFNSSQVSMTCAFCSSEYFMEIPESEDEKKERQDAEIILFKFDKEQGKKIFSDWIKKGLFKPNDLTNTFKHKEFDGVYIPFYKVNADAVSNWNGRDKFEVKSAEGDKPAVYEYKPRSGTHGESYKDFITATHGLDQNEVDRIQPFDDNDTKPYDQELLMGYKFENPGIKKDNAEEKSRERIRGWEKQACSSLCDEMNSVSTTISNLRSRLMMLPLWILVYLYKNKPFRVLINGQTGKIAGKKPVSGIKVLIFILIILAVIAAVAVIATR
ncbi:MAG: hypothetical protein E4H36_10555 [Spirochaetales bacterium]|nr:MAG: hypothetical protein E4H36_10555 [Spirochaetales bacterium]